MKLRGVRHIYSQALDIRVGALRVKRFSLNRHLPEKGWVEPHRHRHAQFLLYLTGSGRQRVEAAIHPVKPGAVFYLAKGCEHSFVEGKGRRPFCLALDFDFPGESSPARGLLAQGELRIVRQSISMLHVWQGGPAEVRPREAGAVLTILDVLMRAVGLIRQERGRVTLAVVRRVQEIFHEEAQDRAPVARAAERVGYHPDHLSRLLKRETGMSAAQLRATERLKLAKQQLARTITIADAGQACGFADPNYFSRWFRRQTGVTPRAWRQGVRREGP